MLELDLDFLEKGDLVGHVLLLDLCFGNKIINLVVYTLLIFACGSQRDQVLVEHRLYLTLLLSTACRTLGPNS